MGILLAIIITVFSFEARGDVKSCLSASPQFYSELRALLSDSVDPSSFNLGASCRELSNPNSYSSISDSDLKTVIAFNSYNYLIQGQSKEIKSAYLEKLKAIARIQDRNTRILQAYQLATKAFAEFNLQQFKEEAAKAKLRDYAAQKAALLAYSLEQVRKIKSEFNVTHLTVFESDPSKRRSVVRIELSKTGGKPGVFDLDPHSAGINPSPLVTLFKPIPEDDRQVLQLQCERLMLCLLDQSLKQRPNG